MADASYQPKVYRKQGGEELIVASGGTLDVESGGSLKIAGTAITATAAEINKLALASFNNKSGYVARVNSGETALEYVVPTAIPVGGTFTNKSKYVARVNAGETAMECVAPTALEIGGAYTNSSKYLARVNAGETAMEYVAPTAVEIGGAFTNNGRRKVRVNAGETALEYVADGELKNEVGTTYAFVAGDEGKVITFENDAAITATIPANSSVAFPVGTEIELVQKGAGAVTVAITDDTLNVISTKTRVTAGAWGVAKLRKIAATIWVISGDLAAA
ncbi:MAG: hypothetical protein M0R06_01710 [Sphaerochaeta sp.]|jgi:hypothetical protein|nr:hypothetical protein [Sphaerochaeta sp.]